MIKIKDQCKQTAPARVFHLSLAGAAFYILSLIRCGGLFKFCRDLLEQFTDGKMLGTDLFAIMNAKQIHHDWNADCYYEDVHTAPGRKASDCLKCGKCEKVCPQHLPIRKLLEKVAAEFEKEQ